MQGKRKKHGDFKNNDFKIQFLLIHELLKVLIKL